ncbi:hypothetical protein ACFHWD_04150 [Clostridium sp. MT-14]|uniref:hypothetical protein n=1 Tax=Clostridium sp. MT-14 TaxID=3348360 RepID=UPI0035F38A21
MPDSNILPYDFNKIIHYNNINISTSNFTGYTVNTKDKTIKLNISDLDNINKSSKKEELLNTLKNAKRAGEKINKLESNINSLKDKTENIQKTINTSVHNANDKPIVGGIGQNSGIDYRGLYSHELGNSDKGIRITNGMLGYYRNGDKEFQPILTSDGLVPDAITQIINISKIGTNQGSNSSNNGGDGGSNSNTNSGNNNSGSSINLLELPSEYIYDSEGKRIIETDYIQNEIILYKELFGRNVDGRINQIVLCDKDGNIIKTTEFIRDENNKVIKTNYIYY